MENTPNRFDEAALTWDDDPRKIERARLLAEEIRPLVERYQLRTALDFGAGTGLISFFLAENLDQITLVDTSEGMTEMARQKIRRQGLTNFKAVTADLSREAWPHRYDLIYTLMTLHHIQDTQQILKQFYKMLYPGGILCIADLDEEDGSFHAGIPGFDGHNGFNQEELASLLQKTGFRGVKSKIFHTVEGKQRSYPLFFMEGKKEENANREESGFINKVELNQASAILKKSGKEFIPLFEHGSLEVELYQPGKIDNQKPHLRDEIYIIASGNGKFFLEGKITTFTAGDFLFVPAHAGHRFLEFTDDFSTWVIFYGPEGGEKGEVKNVLEP